MRYTFYMFIVTVFLGVNSSIIYAENLPSDIEYHIVQQAELGKRHKILAANYIDKRRLSSNWHLEAAVVSAVEEFPEHFSKIMRVAYSVAPDSRANLNKLMEKTFPGFAQDLIIEKPILLPEKKAKISKKQSKIEYTNHTSLTTERPKDWPILPNEGGLDGYANKDPLEDINKIFFYTNGALDFVIFEPLAKVYRFVTPKFARQSMRSAFSNLSLPVVVINKLLQFQIQNATETFSRFAINSTIGVFGLFDIASIWGLEEHNSDFGTTLHHYGVEDGIYLVLPLFGPTTVRDAIGIGFDSIFDPRTWLLKTNFRLGLYVTQGVVHREQIIEPVNFLVKNSKDPYSAVRAWTFQQRNLELSEH